MSDCYTYKDGILKIEDEEIGISISKEYKLPELPEKLLMMSSIPSYITIERDEKGNILEAYQEQNGEVHGELKTFSTDGVLAHRSYYHKGQLIGPSFYYSDSGGVLTETWYVDGKKQGKARQFYQKGSLYSLQRYADGQSQGEQIFFYENGKLKTKMHYENGRLHGSVKLYYDNENLKREIEYDKGERINWEIEFDEQGTKRFEVLHPNQEVVRSWYPDGRMAEERLLLKDIKIGKAKATPKIYNIRKWRTDGFLFWDEKFDKEHEMFQRVRLSPETKEAAVSRGRWDEDSQSFIWG
jgi:antitoxin component YwqK of YwqJK toxin-antitoxin module